MFFPKKHPEIESAQDFDNLLSNGIIMPSPCNYSPQHSRDDKTTLNTPEYNLFGVSSPSKRIIIPCLSEQITQVTKLLGDTTTHSSKPRSTIDPNHLTSK